MKIYEENGHYYINDEGQIKECSMGANRAGKPELKLPENSTGRKYYVLQKKFYETGEDEIFGIDRGPKNENQSKTKSAKKNWWDYLNDDRRKLYDELKAEGEANMNDPKIIEREKLMKNIQRENKRLDEYMKEYKEKFGIEYEG